MITEVIKPNDVAFTCVLSAYGAAIFDWGPVYVLQNIE